MTLPRAHALAGRTHAVGTDPGHGRSERIWEQRLALGRRLAALRSRSGFSQWDSPITGYSRSTLSDAELAGTGCAGSSGSAATTRSGPMAP